METAAAAKSSPTTVIDLASCSDESYAPPKEAAALTTTKKRKPKRSSSSKPKKKKPPAEEEFQVDGIVRVKHDNNGISCLIKWVGYPDSENTWEPLENLSDDLQQKAQAMVDNTREETIVHKPKRARTCPKNTHSTTAPAGPLNWTDEELLEFRPVQRIRVNDANAGELVRDLREAGIPFVLTGHKGWPEFARGWLNSNPQQECLDLSRGQHELNVSAMKKAIGTEKVPILRSGYNEYDPLDSKEWTVSKFLDHGWKTNNPKAKKQVYLHQWQFPLSETPAATRLCQPGQVNPLPSSITGLDLLDFAYEDGNPYQYIFMGQEGTFSKLHRDQGGLAITIAPIVGQKECLMVHRSNGPNALYHLAADLDNINLFQYPLLCHARVWKTTVKPGEILFMPQGTYHQCRNVSACLSYSRFVLDTVNLLPFLESMFNGDAGEIEHSRVLKESTKALSDQVSEATTSNAPMTNDLQRTVTTLRKLLFTCQEVARRYRRNSHLLSAAYDVDENEQEEDAAKLAQEWTQLVTGVADTLHKFRYRQSPKAPRLKWCREEGTMAQTEEEKAFYKLKDFDPGMANGNSQSTTAYSVGEKVQVKVHRKMATGEIVAVEEGMRAALLHYEDYTQYFAEFQPLRKLRQVVPGDNTVEINLQAVQPGMVVVNRWGDLGEEYKAKVRSLHKTTFYEVQLSFGGYQPIRWVPADHIIANGAGLEG